MITWVYLLGVAFTRLVVWRWIVRLDPTCETAEWIGWMLAALWMFTLPFVLPLLAYEYISNVAIARLKTSGAHKR